MPRSWMVITCPQAPKLGRDLHEMADRFVSGGGWDNVIDLTEDAHRRFFNRLRGRYVRTGAVRESLTQSPANGAIREIHGNSLRFGTSVWYAHFLTKSPRDPEAGQVPKGEAAETSKGANKRSAVVIFPRSLERSVSKELLFWISEPFEEESPLSGAGVGVQRWEAF